MVDMSQPISQQLVSVVERVAEGARNLRRLRKAELVRHAAGLGVNTRRRGPDGKPNVWRCVQSARLDCAARTLALANPPRAVASQVTLDRYVGTPGQVPAPSSGSDPGAIAPAPVSDSASARMPAQPEATRARVMRGMPAASAERKRYRALLSARARVRAREHDPEKKAQGETPRGRHVSAGSAVHRRGLRVAWRIVEWRPWGANVVIIII